ncbi:MAG: protease inhibitor I42 family protein [Candidatus Omnitrophota bacterium]
MKKTIFSLLIIFLICIVSIVFAGQDFSRKFKVIRVPLGKVIAIPLDSNPSTGFSWQLVKISDKMILEFVKKEYIANSGNTVGSGGIESWSFKTLKHGTAIIVLEYVRAWEKDLATAKKEEFTVFVE